MQRRVPKCVSLLQWLNIASGMQILFVYVRCVCAFCANARSLSDVGGKTLFENGI